MRFTQKQIYFQKNFNIKRMNLQTTLYIRNLILKRNNTLYHIVCRIYKSRRNEPLLPITPNNPIPIRIFSIQNYKTQLLSFTVTIKCKINQSVATNKKKCRVSTNSHRPVTNSPLSTETSFSSRAINVYKTM